jgi:predicted MPP superfamily phosphohydrolase
MRKFPFLPRVILLASLLHIYVGVRLLPDMPIGYPGRWIGAAILAIMCLVEPLGLLSRSIKNQPLSDRVAWVGYIAMGFFSSIFVFTAIRDVFYLLGAVVVFIGKLGSPPAWLNAASALAVVAIALVISSVGFYNARRLARVVNIEVPIDQLNPELIGYSIVQISDLHIGPTIKKPYIERLVRAVNALGPDLIAVTGDLVDGSPAHLRQDAAPLGDLKARHGVFMVTGNHEYYAGADRWRSEFERLGLTILDNSHVLLGDADAQLLLAGVCDWSATGFTSADRSDADQAIAGAPSDITRVLLAHQPRSAFSAEQAGFHLQLSGHTHGGQFFPWMFLVRMQQPFRSGLHRLGQLWVYTSRGTGYWGPPLRFGAPSEITHLRLVAAAP